MENRKTLLLSFLSTIFFICLIQVNLFSQDTILTTSNKIIVGKVLEVSKWAIRYTTLPDTNRLKSIYPGQVSKIHYSNNTSEVFNPFLITVVLDSTKSTYQLGKNNGKLNSHFKGIAVLTFSLATAGTILVSGIYEDFPQNLFPAPICILTIAAIPPKSYSGNSQTFPYNDPEFRRGFDIQRRKEKRKAALKGFALGVLMDAIFVLIGSRN